jgi:hypothetical protein
MPKPPSKKSKQKAAAAAMAAAADSEVPETGVEGSEAPELEDAGGSLIPAAGAAKAPESDGATTIAAESVREDSATVSSSTTKDTALEAFLAESSGEDLHWRLMSEAMASMNITTSTYQSRVHPNSKDVHLSDVRLILKGKEIMTDAEITLNWGQRYGLIGPNGCGKSLLLSVIGRRLLPLPANLDVHLLMSEIEASDMTALEAVLTVDEERKKVEAAVEVRKYLQEGKAPLACAAAEFRRYSNFSPPYPRSCQIRLLRRC